MEFDAGTRPFASLYFESLYVAYYISHHSFRLVQFASFQNSFRMYVSNYFIIVFTQHISHHFRINQYISRRCFRIIVCYIVHLHCGEDP